METAHHQLRFYQAQYQPSFLSPLLDADQAKVDDYLSLGADALNTPNIDPDFFNEGNLFSSEKLLSHHHNHHHQHPLKSAKVDPLLGCGSEDSMPSSAYGTINSLSSATSFGDALTLAPVSGSATALQQHQNNNVQQTITTSSSYSPQQQLEISSQIININSPEMMSSSSSSTSSTSPNNKSSSTYLDSGSASFLPNIEDDPAFYSQVAEYEQLAFYGSPAADNCGSSYLGGNSAPNSRSSSISSGSGCEGGSAASNYEYLLADLNASSELNSSLLTQSTATSSPNNSNNSTSISTSNASSSQLMLAPSPANSHYSSDSASSKTFTNLDAVQQQQQVLTLNGQLITIKQEPVDNTLYQPTVIEEFESAGQQQQQLYQINNNDAYTTINTADLYAYCGAPQQQQQQQYSSSAQLPSTVSSVLLQQQQQQPQMQQLSQQASTSHHHQTGRKRNAAAAFSSASSSASSGSSASTTPAAAGASTSTSTSSTKKPRMTKREKQKMMESDIGKFETENRDLRQSIDLLERQIAFCKRFLSENVAPVIQRQQANSSTSNGGGGQFGCSPMMIAVSEM